MIVHNLNPIIAQIGPFTFYWYGLMYVIGFIYMFYMLTYLFKKKKVPHKKGDVEELLVLFAVGMIIGARLFEVIIYNPSYYFANPSQIIAIWKGGLSFHGALIGSTIAMYYFARKKKIKFLQIADLLVIPIGIALMLGRIGNFINGELYGRITNVPWCMKFPSIEGCRHPSQLYEAGKNLLIFIILWNLKDKKKPNGWFFAMFLILYGILRFTIEFVREPEVMVGPLTVGQVLCVLMIGAGLGLMHIIKKKKFIND